jgi:hypothetical protein
MRMARRLGLIAAGFALASCSGKTGGDDLFGDASSPADGGSTSSADDGGSSTSPNVSSAIVLDIRTDMKIPSDIDTVRIEISQNGTTQYASDFDLQTTYQLPASFTLCASDPLCAKVEQGVLPPGKIVILDPAALFIVRLIGLRRGQAVTLRAVRTSLPPTHAARLRLIAEAACRGQVVQQGQTITSSCTDDQSCVAGSCAPIDVDSSTLPEAT